MKTHTEKTPTETTTYAESPFDVLLDKKHKLLAKPQGPELKFRAVGIQYAYELVAVEACPCGLWENCPAVKRRRKRVITATKIELS